MKLGIFADFPEEGWPSMDLCAEMLASELARSGEVQATPLCPKFKKRLSFLGGAGRNFDRLTNRMWHYPRWARKRAGEFDCFHIVDHSYSQLVHELPAEHTGVFLHDLDTFRCILEPQKERRPKWFRAMAQRILRGMQKARVLFYLTEPIRAEAARFGLLDEKVMVACPPAAAPEFKHEGAKARRIHPLVGDASYLMHVGSCIARKRIDVLLEVFARVRRGGLKLVQVGGEFTVEQRALIERLGIGSAVVQLRRLDREAIADLYRGAKCVLQTSEAEGFGLPLVEALACGTAVVASDIPVLREVGGEAALYCSVGNVDAWAQTLAGLIDGGIIAPALDLRLTQAAKFSWAAHARIIASAYHDILEGRR